MFRKSLAFKAAAVLAGLFLLSMGPWPFATHYVHAQAPAEAKIRVEITDKGFNDQPSDFVIEVEQGQVVELTFVWAHQALVREAHIMVLKGYNLESDEINYYNREATIKFVADKPGTFELRCDLDCDIHDKLKSGLLKVTQGGGSGASAVTSGAASAAIAATSLALYPSTREATGGPVNLTASLKDAQGAPVSKAEVRFYVEAEFAGTKGLMEIGVAKTDKDGVARREYTPTVAGEQRVLARFEGMGLYGASEQTTQIRVPAITSAYSVAPVGLNPIREWAPFGLGVVVLMVWLAFAYVVYQLYRIVKARS